MTEDIPKTAAKFINNLQTLIDFIKTYGNAYNPAQDYLQIPYLENLLATAKQLVIEDFQRTQQQKQKLKEQTLAYSDLRILFKRIVDFIPLTTDSKYSIEQAKAYNRKMQGKLAPSTIQRHKRNNTPPEKIRKPNKPSQFSQLIYFSELLQFVKHIPTYKPYHIDLEIITLTQFKSNIELTNQELYKAESKCYIFKRLRYLMKYSMTIIPMR